MTQSSKYLHITKSLFKDLIRKTSKQNFVFLRGEENKKAGMDDCVNEQLTFG
jgi:hypothetical protein